MIVTYSTPRSVQKHRCSFDLVRQCWPSLSFGPDPESLTLLECSDGYVIIVGYGKVAAVLHHPRARTRGTYPMAVVVRDVTVELERRGSMVAPLAAIWAAMGWTEEAEARARTGNAPAVFRGASAVLLMR